MKNKIAVICPPLQGHINPMSVIAYELKQNNRNIFFIGLLDIREYIQEFQFIPIGTQVFPKNSIPKITKKMARLKGLRMGRYWQSKFANKWSEIVCEQLPEILKHNHIDIIICDQLEAAVALVADKLKIPFITVCNAMAIVMDNTIPPFFTSWSYKTTDTRLNLNEAFYKVADFILKHDTRALEEWRKKWDMPTREGMNRYFAVSPLLTLCQQSPSLEFPRTKINRDWYYCGPFRNSTLSPYPNPNLSNEERKFVYVSFGSLLGSRFRLLKKCIKISHHLGLEPVIAHAGLLKKKEVKKLQKYAHVYEYVKQPEIFNQCDLLISHCGLNTVLDALSYGRPILALPIGIEQGAIATKLKRVGCALIVKRKWKRKIRKTLSELLSNPEYVKNALSLKKEIENAGGEQRALELIEKSLRGKSRGIKGFNFV
ncbi:MAG: putative Glycosyltransferase, MGT family [Promethearchaeota archaeon]|nr:MAG: putative Glycosyltransferase, MGT family [Candidatus Lokiarchaeota archaeon]